MKRPVYECDGCGERHGHRTEMHEVRIRHRSGEWESPEQETLHVCIACDGLEDAPTGASASISDTMEVWHEFLVDGPTGPVVGLRTSEGHVVLREDLNVPDHGNVALIRDAMDGVEALL